MADGRALRASVDHLVRVDFGKDDFRRAGDLAIGDSVVIRALTRPSLSRIVDIAIVRDVQGVFAPLTDTGELVVDGVFVSSYALSESVAWAVSQSTIQRVAYPLMWVASFMNPPFTNEEWYEALLVWFKIEQSSEFQAQV
ncbi:hypothetical protein FOL47_007934 [Perkinsus chesapeaki]|uniref:Hedgehog protein Hint domain-containing protein n=1 Tax=Perkinsus chesapeaki TaxID=330153 RepID=A0A7J6MVH1_PERCH|nr:hypothetical protein FOL47_007934 [Perkinsus chesapeaki]